jgi:calcium-dependent protein kinase
LVATINKQKLLTNEILWNAFQLFDKDGGGTITSAEVKAVLNPGGEFDEDLWDKILAEVDVDGSGEIDY